MSYKNKILEYINSTDHYNRTSNIAEAVDCSYSTALKWVKELCLEEKIRSVNIGIYSASFRYLSIKTSENIRANKRKY